MRSSRRKRKCQATSQLAPTCFKMNAAIQRPNTTRTVRRSVSLISNGAPGRQRRFAAEKRVLIVRSSSTDYAWREHRATHKRTIVLIKLTLQSLKACCRAEDV